MNADLHRHGEFSSFDGFGNAKLLAQTAKQKGYTALGLSDHGTTSGLIQHYFACKEVGIKPILGVEAYFRPKLKPEESKENRTYHLCLFAKNVTGYTNLNQLMTIAEEQKYYKPYVTFKDLRRYHEGILCSSACVAGYAAQMLINGKRKLAIKYLLTMQEIFEDDFYIEIQPYTIDEPGLQEKVNVELIELAEKYGIPCILTSDSHYSDKREFQSYLKMHEIDNHNLEHIRGTYKERYMPESEELRKRFINMHQKDFQHVGKLGMRMAKNMRELIKKVDGDIIDKIRPELPIFDPEQDSMTLLKKKIKSGLKRRNKLNKTYLKRCAMELKVIESQHLADYFLIVQDYINWAKVQGIAVGPGRGSGCNCLINYALGITDVDSLYFNLDFRRFLRMDKIKMPEQYWAFVVNVA